MTQKYLNFSCKLQYPGLEMLILQGHHVAIQIEVIYTWRPLRDFVQLFLKLLIELVLTLIQCSQWQ